MFNMSSNNNIDCFLGPQIQQVPRPSHAVNEKLNTQEGAAGIKNNIPTMNWEELCF